MLARAITKPAKHGAGTLLEGIGAPLVPVVAAFGPLGIKGAVEFAFCKGNQPHDFLLGVGPVDEVTPSGRGGFGPEEGGVGVEPVAAADGVGSMPKAGD